MTESLPPRPDIDWLKKAAKQRLAALRADDPATKLHQAQLDIARRYGFKSWRALKAEVDALSLDGQIVAATCEGRADDLAALLRAHPAKIGIIGGHWGRPLLHLAAEHGHLDCVDLLLRLGFDVNLRDPSDRASALHWAAQEGRLEVVKRLVAAGADVRDEGDAHGMGVIGWATNFQQVRQEVAAFLMEVGGPADHAHPVGVAPVLDLGPGGDEPLDHLELALLGGPVQRRGAIRGVAQRHVEAEPKQQVDAL